MKNYFTCVKPIKIMFPNPKSLPQNIKITSIYHNVTKKNLIDFFCAFSFVIFGNESMNFNIYRQLLCDDDENRWFYDGLCDFVGFFGGNFRWKSHFSLQWKTQITFRCQWTCKGFPMHSPQDPRINWLRQTQRVTEIVCERKSFCVWEKL